MPKSVRLYQPDAPTGGQPDQPTIRDLVAHYLADVELRHSLRQLTAGAVACARHYLGAFVDLYGDQGIGQCSSTDLVKWLIAHPEWRSDHTKNSALGAVVSCFRWCEEERHIDRTPYRRPRRLRLNLRPRSPITRPQLVALHRAAMESPQRKGRGRYKAGRAFRRMLYALRRTGARPCELRNATWEQVDWQAGVLRQQEHKTDRGGDVRTIGLDPGLLRLLRVLHDRRNPDRPHIFLNAWGNRWLKASFTQLFRKFARRAGLPAGVSAYSIRHGFATEAVELGISDRALADQMGHKSTRYVSWYAAQSRQHADHLRNVTTSVQRGKKKPLPPKAKPQGKGLFDDLD